MGGLNTVAPREGFSAVEAGIFSQVEEREGTRSGMRSLQFLLFNVVIRPVAVYREEFLLLSGPAGQKIFHVRHLDALRAYVLLCRPEFSAKLPLPC